jgi:hypothetical protein
MHAQRVFHPFWPRNRGLVRPCSSRIASSLTSGPASESRRAGAAPRHARHDLHPAVSKCINKHQRRGTSYGEVPSAKCATATSARLTCSAVSANEPSRALGSIHGCSDTTRGSWTPRKMPSLVDRHASLCLHHWTLCCAATSLLHYPGTVTAGGLR